MWRRFTTLRMIYGVQLLRSLASGLAVITALAVAACGDAREASPTTSPEGTPLEGVRVADLLKYDFPYGREVQLQSEGFPEGTLHWRVANGVLRVDDVRDSAGVYSVDGDPTANPFSGDRIVCDWYVGSNQTLWNRCEENAVTAGRDVIDLVHLVMQGAIEEEIEGQTILGQPTNCFSVSYNDALRRQLGRICVTSEGVPMTISGYARFDFVAFHAQTSAPGQLRPVAGVNVDSEPVQPEDIALPSE